MVAVASTGALIVMEGNLSIGGLAACTLLAGRSMQPILRGLGLWSQYQSITIAEDRLKRIFDSQPEAPVSTKSKDEIEGGIEIEALAFSYGPDDPCLLDGLSLKIHSGDIISLNGDSGSGKTTFLMLLMGLLQPTAGKILIDGHDLGEFDPYTLRKQIAFLPQTATLFQGSIMDNLTLFEGGNSIKKALEAARLLGVDDAIRHLPEGYQTEVGRGAPTELPVGLKQGIAMARAIAREPKIILFDEANGGLDSAADSRLKDALLSLKGKCTIIIVSHRPSLLSLGGCRYFLKDRKLELVEDENPKAKRQTATIEVLAEQSDPEPPHKNAAISLMEEPGSDLDTSEDDADDDITEASA